MRREEGEEKPGGTEVFIFRASRPWDAGAITNTFQMSCSLQSP